MPGRSCRRKQNCPILWREPVAAHRHSNFTSAMTCDQLAIQGACRLDRDPESSTSLRYKIGLHALSANVPINTLLNPPSLLRATLFYERARVQTKEFSPYESRPRRELFLWKSPDAVRSHEAVDRCPRLCILQCQQSSTQSFALVNRTHGYPHLL